MECKCSQYQRTGECYHVGSIKLNKMKYAKERTDNGQLTYLRIQTLLGKMTDEELETVEKEILMGAKLRQWNREIAKRTG